MKTRRMVQALYDLFGCDHDEHNGTASIRTCWRPGLLARNNHEHESTKAMLDWHRKLVYGAQEQLEALLDHLGLEAQDFPAGVRIVKTKKAKGTKRA